MPYSVAAHIKARVIICSKLQCGRTYPVIKHLPPSQPVQEKWPFLHVAVTHLSVFVKAANESAPISQAEPSTHFPTHVIPFLSPSVSVELRSVPSSSSSRLPDSNSDKENSQHSRSLSSSRRLPSHSDNANSTAAPSSNPPHQHRRFDYVELSPVTATTGPGSSGQREAGEGQVKAESGSWREESRDATSSQWEAVLSRKGVGQGGDGRVRIEDEIERKWAEFERLPLREMRSLPSMGSHSGPGSGSGSGTVGGGPPSSEALQREVVRGDDFSLICKRLKRKLTNFIC